MGTVRGTFVAEHPQLVTLWDFSANGTATPETVGAGSSYRRAWTCPVAEDHRWMAPPASMVRSMRKGFTGCPSCAGRQLSVTNSFAARYPQGVALWHPTLNGSLTPDRVLAGSPEKVWWVCAEGPEHAWQAAPLVLGKQSLAKGNSGCPYCRGFKASVTNSVASRAQLAAEWHPTKNGNERPEDVVAGTARKLWWQCVEDSSHEWQSIGVNRLKGRGCPFCTKSLRSVLEVCLAFEMQAFFPEVDLAKDKVRVDGVIRHVDILVESLAVIVEVDGRRHHSAEDQLARDIAKTSLLEAAGYRVLRVREAPLPPVTPYDVMLPQHATVKQTANAVLRQLHALGWGEVTDLQEYLERETPIRVVEASTYLHDTRQGKPYRMPRPPGLPRAARWERAFVLLSRFVEREGHAEVPDEHVEAGITLGSWVSTQRTRYRRGKLDPERVARLDGIPGWVWSAVEQDWEVGYQHLLAYVEREGHPRVPAEHRESDGYPLGSWARSHRRPGGGRRTMTADQKARLESLPGWTH